MSRQHGFTLVEILVALTVSALILSAVYGIFVAVSTAQEELGEDGEAFHQARVFYSRVAREIRGAFWRRGDPATVFRGGIDTDGQPFLELTTTAVSPVLPEATGISLVHYRLEADPELRAPGLFRLLRREQSLLPGAEAGGMEHQLGSAVQQWRLRFYNGTEWLEEWDSSRLQQLPLLVEIAMVLDVGGRRQPFLTSMELIRLEVN